MKNFKIITVLLILLFNISVFAGGYTNFNVSGQTVYQLTQGQTSVDARLDFSYYSYNFNIDYSYLAAKLDGSQYTMYGYNPSYRTFENLTAGTHTIELTLYQGYDLSGPTVILDQETVTIQVIAAPQPPPAPSLTSSFHTNQVIHLNWNSVPGAVSYRIYKIGFYASSISNGWTDLGNTFSIDDYPSYTPDFSSFVPGIRGFAEYRVFAVDANGLVSQASNTFTYGVRYSSPIY